MAGDTDAGDDDVDPAELQRQLAAIKAGMGLSDRYPGQRRLWLVAGVAVAVAAVATNAAFAVPLPYPSITYVAIWFGLAGVVLISAWRLVSKSQPATALPGPDWGVVAGALALGLFALWFALGDLVAANTSGALRGAHYFSHLLVFLGVGFLLAGAVLRTQRIRHRDRVPFYVGGLWMLVLAAFVPHVPALRLGGYAVFGVLFLVHSIGTYLLTATD